MADELYTEQRRDPRYKKGRLNDMRSQFEGDVNQTMKEGGSRYNLAPNAKPSVPPPTMPPQSGGTPQQVIPEGAPNGPQVPGAPTRVDQLKPTGAGPNGPPPEYDPEAVSEEEQQVYDQLVIRAVESIANNAGSVLDQMNRTDTPVYENVGRTGLMILRGIEKMATAKGAEIEPDMMMAAGQEVVERLMELGDVAGIWPFEKDSDEYNETMVAALYHGVELAGNEALAGPKGQQLQNEAGNVVARQIAKEREAGKLHPEFDEVLQSQVGLPIAGGQ